MGNYSNEIKGIDIPSIYMAAQQYRANEQAMTLRDQEQQRQVQLRDLYAGAIAGDQTAVSRLQQADPQGFMQFEQNRQQQAAAQQKLLLDQQTAQRNQQDQKIQNLTTLGKMYTAMDQLPEQDRPKLAEAIGRHAVEFGFIKPEEVPKDMDGVNALRAQAAAAYRALRPPEETTDWRNYQHSKDDAAFAAYQEKMRRAGAIQMPGALDKTNVSNFNADIVDKMTLLQKLDQLDAIDENEMLGWVGQGKTFVASMKDKAGGWLGDLSEADQSRLADADVFDGIAESIALGVQKELTGVSGPPEQLRLIAKTTLSTAKGPTQFRAAKQRVRQEAERLIALKKQVIDSGIPLNSPDFAPAYMKLYNQSNAAANRPPGSGQAPPGAQMPPPTPGGGAAPPQAPALQIHPDTAAQIQAEGDALIKEPGATKDSVRAKLLQKYPYLAPGAQ